MGSMCWRVPCLLERPSSENLPSLSSALPSERAAEPAVRAEIHAIYLAEIEREAVRARRRYDLLVLPGLELTYNDLDPLRAAHAVAVGLEGFVSVDHGIAEAMEHARAGGAAIIAAHPFDDEHARNPERLTRAFATDTALRGLADRFELFNRTTLFGWVSRAGLPAVATGDFHRLEPSLGLEDPAAVRAQRRRSRRLPSLTAPRLPHPGRCRTAPCSPHRTRQ